MPGNPTKPRHPDNPVGQTKRIRQAKGAWTNHIRPIRKWLMETLEDIPKNQIEANVGRVFFAPNNGLAPPETWHGDLTVNLYEYQISAARLEEIVQELAERLGDAPPREALRDRVRAAYEQGTGDEVENLISITDGEYTRDITQVITSDAWQRRVALIEARVLEDMQGFQGETGRELNRVLREGVENGLNPRDVAKDIRRRFSVSQSRAQRIARTEITQSYRRARLDQDEQANEEQGIRTRLLWFSALSSTTRPDHAAKHGLTLTQQEVRDFYSRDGNAINCYLPGTKVRGRFVAGSKAHYSGEAVRIMTAGGRDLSVTPNHPVMTDRGLIPAAEVAESDNLIADVRERKDLCGVSNLDGELVDPRVEDVFSSIKNIGHSFTAGVSGVDFYGDGAFINKDVEVVDMEGVLTYGGDSASFQFLNNLGFVSTDPVAPERRPLPLGFNGVLLPAPALMCVAGEFFSVLRRRLLEPLKAGLTTASIFKVFGLKPAVQGNSGNSCGFADGKYGFSGHVSSVESGNVEGSSPSHVSDEPPYRNSKLLSDRLEALPGIVALDSVVSVSFSHYSGHVYDLQELSGLMVAGGVITSNCKCTQQSVLVDEDGNPVNKGFVKEVRDKEKRNG